MQLPNLSRCSLLLIALAGTAAAQNPPCNGGIAAHPYAGNNQGSPGGAVYFDLTVTSNVSIGNLETNYNAVAGLSVGMTVYTTPTTHIGNEANMAAWTLVGMDDGTAIAAGVEMPTAINLMAPFNLAPGTYGIALVASGSGHRYTNGTGANQMYSNGPFSISAGAASNAPFAGTPFTPRIWNGSLCEAGPGAGLGTSYCGPANANTSGNPAVITAAGSDVAATNDVTLTASDMPANQFGFFLASMTQGFVPNPNGSDGNLCLGGTIGRYVAAGQIKNSGAGGTFDLTLDLTQTPAGPVFVSIAAGETWNFQAWFRDLDPMGGPQSNFTDGRSILFN